MRKAQPQQQDNNLALVPVKHEVLVVNHDEEEFIEIEEEPNTGVQEEWEKDIPPFLRKLSTMVNDNRDILIRMNLFDKYNDYEYWFASFQNNKHKAGYSNVLYPINYIPPM